MEVAIILVSLKDWLRLAIPLISKLTMEISIHIANLKEYGSSNHFSLNDWLRLGIPLISKLTMEIAIPIVNLKDYGSSNHFS